MTATRDVAVVVVTGIWPEMRWELSRVEINEHNSVVTGNAGVRPYNGENRPCVQPKSFFFFLFLVCWCPFFFSTSPRAGEWNLMWKKKKRNMPGVCLCCVWEGVKYIDTKKKNLSNWIVLPLLGPFAACIALAAHAHTRNAAAVPHPFPKIFSTKERSVMEKYCVHNQSFFFYVDLWYIEHWHGLGTCIASISKW